MAELITDTQLTEKICDIIFSAKKELLIISPYIKLDDYFKKEVFDKHKEDPELHLMVAFGKNVEDPLKSLNKEDFDYFKDFKNVSIIYVPTLHAKFYANENTGVVTSINLYDYSFKNNIEFGVVSEKNLISPSKLGKQAWEQSMKILNSNDAVFIRRPQYKKGLMKKNYMGSINLLDVTEDLLNGSKIKKSRLAEYESEILMGGKDKKERRSRDEFDIQNTKSSQELLSATALGKLKEKSHAEVLEIMKVYGMIIDKATITEKGLNSGIQLRTNSSGGSWLVYPETMVQLLD